MMIDSTDTLANRGGTMPDAAARGSLAGYAARNRSELLARVEKATAYLARHPIAPDSGDAPEIVGKT